MHLIVYDTGNNMKYTIGQTAARMGVTISALRYYDKEGLLPFVDKKENGVRVFKDGDFQWLNVISCMKNTGMPIKDIKKYIDLCMEGDNTLEDRLQIFQNRKDAVLKQIDDLKGLLETINHKINYYEEAIMAGTEAIHKQNTVPVTAT